jgi:predicted NUDIX family NTP pyrophosphohydrolase
MKIPPLNSLGADSKPITRAFDPDMVKNSAGLLMHRRRKGELEVLLVHPGGPFWAKKDPGSWSIPKGEFEAGEDPLASAQREFREETGFDAEGEFVPLKNVKQPSGKIVHAWAVEGDCDAEKIKSNSFSLEWPPKSGRRQEFPEVDRAGWFTMDVARTKIVRGQVAFLDELKRVLGSGENKI